MFEIQKKKIEKIMDDNHISTDKFEGNEEINATSINEKITENIEKPVENENIDPISMVYWVSDPSSYVSYHTRRSTTSLFVSLYSMECSVGKHKSTNWYKWKDKRTCVFVPITVKYLC